MSIRNVSKRFNMGEHNLQMLSQIEKLLWENCILILMKKRNFFAQSGSKIDSKCYEWIVVAHNKGIFIIFVYFAVLSVILLMSQKSKLYEQYNNVKLKIINI